jgi:hypothetical protein
VFITPGLKRKYNTEGERERERERERIKNIK